MLPTVVRVTSQTHPLYGQLLEARGFKRVDGLVQLVVVLPDSSPGTIRADATNVFGERPVNDEDPGATVLSVEGVRRLRALVAGSAAAQRRVADASGRGCGQ
ncbi:MAG: hypothetical protein ACRDZO_10005 [Egibacteraceae bacterium]